MDEYGSFRHTKEEAYEVAKANLFGEADTTVFQWSPDGFGALICVISPRFGVLGIMGFGGNPRGRCFVGIYGRGCGHLSMEKGPYASYIEEKLNIKGEEAEKFCEFYSWIVEAWHEMGAYKL